MSLEYNCGQFKLRPVRQCQAVLGDVGLLYCLLGNVDVSLVCLLFNSLGLFQLFVLYFLLAVWTVGGKSAVVVVAI